MTTINTAYSSTIYPGTVKPTETPPPGSTTTPKPTMAATDLRQDVGVEVTLSPAALQALAQQAASVAEMLDEEAQVTEKLKQVLSAIFLKSAKQAEEADKAVPPGLTGDESADTTRKLAAQQASDFFDGKAANPFRGKTPSELAAAIIDKDGKYTVNERRAAWSEFARQDHARIMDDLTPRSEFDKKVNDAEVPKSNTAERNAAAKKATEFLNGGGKVKNPLEGKTRDELTAIIANDTGDYTVNERRTALAQRDVLEKAVLAKSVKTLSFDEKMRANNESVAGASSEAQARARLATRFTNGWDKTNPFSGLSREELNAIVFDETRSYTTNEQRAAFAELKQYLPASAIPADPAAKDTKKTDNKTTDSSKLKANDPYNTQGAYSKYMLQQLQRANNTSYLLGLMGGGGSGFGLANYLRA
ncbi:hypothetical protein [Ferrovibrio sp.]|uniref:hypothetical protein n=1 Tax=Ferrovibrio sp. TaxID=1917215 RepID=UPI000CC82A99|nr:hypothetical protein [Ferrovibrio sp.]PJI43327.1 MAG: hypothetical protein CTR53_03390 [Ferrovibrio sp.]